jgi:hypothetical protein
VLLKKIIVGILVSHESIIVSGDLVSSEQLMIIAFDRLIIVAFAV